MLPLHAEAEVVLRGAVRFNMSDKKFNEFLKGETFAVAGSFREKSKYAYQVLLKLVNKDKKVHPVNPSGGRVEGLKVYKKVGDIPGDLDSVSLVTPPPVTEKIVRECKEKEVNHIWMQPGAESKEAIQYCKDNGIEVISQACILLDV